MYVRVIVVLVGYIFREVFEKSFGLDENCEKEILFGFFVNGINFSNFECSFINIICFVIFSCIFVLNNFI